MTAIFLGGYANFIPSKINSRYKCEEGRNIKSQNKSKISINPINRNE